jgi:hypothetical protein
MEVLPSLRIRHLFTRELAVLANSSLAVQPLGNQSYVDELLAKSPPDVFPHQP